MNIIEKWTLIWNIKVPVCCGKFVHMVTLLMTSQTWYFTVHPQITLPLSFKFVRMMHARQVFELKQAMISLQGMAYFFFTLRLTPGARLPVLGPFRTFAVPSFQHLTWYTTQPYGHFRPFSFPFIWPFSHFFGHPVFYFFGPLDSPC